MKFGNYLKSQREARGWTQPEAAGKIGIEQSYLSKLETGKARPSEEMFERLVAAYEIDLDELAGAVALGDLERMREIAAIRDLVRRGRQATARARHRWLVAGLALLALGVALMSFVVTERRYADDEWVYVSKGVIRQGESDFLFAGFEDLRPGYIAARHADDPLVARLEPDYRFLADYRGEYFIEPVSDGRRVYEFFRERSKPPKLDAHLFHALALAMIIAGLTSLFIARRW